VSTLEQQNQTLQSQNKTLEANTADLQGQLNQSSAATAELQERRPQKVSQAVFFKENSSTLTSEGKRSLDSIAEGLAGSKDKVVIVSGFTDAAEAAGKDPMAKRWQLSSSRALAAAKYLSGRGVDPALIAVAGFGQARPAAPNDSLANRAHNRRVEIMLSPANQQVLTIDLKPAELKKSGTGAGDGQQQ
jgi:chemotaxis protein MotB